MFVSGRDLNVLIYIRRRIAMCCRKLRKLKEAVKMFRDVSLCYCYPMIPSHIKNILVQFYIFIFILFVYYLIILC